MNQFLVSIAMATYNGEKFIRKQLDSILSQTHSNLEIIICDDNSTDNTWEILQQYSKKDGRIKIFRNKKNLGFIKNFEKAISLCSGDYIALSDQDDIWLDNKIEVLLKNIGENLLIHSDLMLIDENDEVINEKWDKCDKLLYEFPFFIFRNVVTGCTTMFKKELLKDVFPIPSKEMYHDWWIALLASRNKSIKYIDIPLVKYRQHSEQVIGATKKKYNFFNKLNNLFSHYFNKSFTKKYMYALKQRNRLNSILKERKEIFNDKEIKILKDGYVYYNDYIEKFLHVNTFLLGIKYGKYIYCKNFFYLRNFLIDLIG